ncbi:hypothetical protein [Nonomuraea longicatena]|uniref:Uncharacterized protein n=1 Tax=Nonomuraea longicatena TaxID=83682 RepID=A0ABP4B2T8_9ACTN
MKITLPLPATLTTMFVVAIEHLAFDLEGVLPWRIGRPHRKAALRALGTPGLTLSCVPTAWRPRGIDLTDADRRLLRRTRRHVLVSSTAPPHALPETVQVARAAARVIAEECSGVVVDPLTARVLPGESGEPSAFRPADDWLGWRVDVHDLATCPPWNPAETRACGCLRVTSRGLRRFALPEVTLDGAACAHSLCAIDLLRAVAQRLLIDHLAFLGAHPEASQRTIDAHLLVHDHEPPVNAWPYDHAFGVSLTPCDDRAPRRLKVGPEPGSGQVRCLRVGPPPGFTGTMNDWLCSTQAVPVTNRLLAA